MSSPDDRVTTEALAEILHCSTWAAGRLMGDKIPAAKVAGRWTARRADVDKYLASRTVTGRQPGTRRPKKKRAKASP